MAKLTDRQKNNIISHWNTGQFTKTELAKRYKVSEKVVRKLVGLEKPSNAHIVEAGILLEVAKKSEKSPNETKIINSAILSGYNRTIEIEKYQRKCNDLQNDLLDGIKNVLSKGTISKPIKLKTAKDLEEIKSVEHDLTSSDYKNFIDAVDKASVSIGANERFSSTPAAQIQNANVNNVEVVEII